MKNPISSILLIIVMVGLWASSAPAFMLGVHMDLTYDGNASRRATAVTNAKSIRATVSRNSFLWHLLEPQKGSFDWSRTDAVIQELQNAGIEPLFCIYGSPSWANGVPTSTTNYYRYVPTDETQFRQWLNDYKTFVAAAVNRYNGKVKKWELWNEENEHFFWKPKPNLDQYIRWFQAIQATIKSIDPSAEVALGGLSGLFSSAPDDYTGKQFLSLLYQKGVFPDIVAIHPYSKTAPDYHKEWDNNFDDIALIKQVMTDSGQQDKNIWVTEWGWSTAVISKETQATWLGMSLQMLKTQYTYVTLATYFLDYDRVSKYYHGLFDSSFQPKPAASVYHEFATLKEPEPPKNVRILLQ